MRNISPVSLNMIAQTVGIEPINIVEINWSGDTVTWIRYSDQEQPGLILGRILKVSNLENVINISGNSSSQSIHIELNDTDGSIKGIINSIDIHKKAVRVLQWFKGIAINDAFVIFEGEISSPILWTEGGRVISFEVVSKLEDKEVGFSAEEGDFEYIPPELIGKAWPLVFGTVARVPSIRVNKIPAGSLSETLGIDEHSINQEAHTRIVTNNIQAHRNCLTNAIFCFTQARQALARASEFRRLQENIVVFTPADKITGSEPDYTSTIDYYTSMADDLQDRGNEYLQQADQISKNMFTVYEYGGSSGLEKPSTQVFNGANFPQNTPMAVTIGGLATNGGATHEGTFSGNTFTITKRITPWQEIGILDSSPVEVTENNVAINYANFISNKKLWIAQGGSTVTISQNAFLPIKYILCMNWCTVLRVWAYRDINGIRQLFPVPADYYTISFELFGTLEAVLLTMHRPLSSYDNQGWDDEIYCDLAAGVGPNVADIIIYLVNKYTTHSCDVASFDIARQRLQNYPANFALLHKPNIITLLEEIAFQSRCAIWYKQGKFYIRYLSEETASVDTFTLADVEENTFELSTTETENIVTRLVAKWKPDYASDDHTMFFRHNVGKYGLHSQDFDFYIYAHQELVWKSAVFWLIQKANTWKRVKFATFLTKLRLETYDIVTLDFPFDSLNPSNNWVANGPIPCRIESVQYDSENHRLLIEGWVPVRLGEMTQYPFAMPHDIDVTIIFPLPEDDAGTPVQANSTASGSLFDRNAYYGGGSFTNSPPNMDRGSNRYNHQPIFQFFPPPSDRNDTFPGGNPSTSTSTYLNPSGISTNVSIGKSINTRHNQWSIKKFVPPAMYKIEPGSFAGFVVGKVSHNIYEVEVYFNGLNEEPTNINVRQLVGAEDDELPNGYAVIVTRVPIIVNDTSQAEYIMNAGTWAPDLADYGT